MTNNEQLYILDTSVLTQAHRVYYPFDIAPPFWNFLISSVGLNKIVSIDRVYEEILKGNDELAKWTEDEFSFAFDDTKDDSELLINYSCLIKWANEQPQFTQPARDEFARAENADSWIIAYAMKNTNYTVVTQEVFKKDIKRKIPIPNVCKAFQIKYIDTFTLLRELGFKFK